MLRKIAGKECASAEMKQEVVKLSVYRAAAYLRLSREDKKDNWDTESGSVALQRAMIEAYVREQEDICLEKEYVDDGFSGLTLQRPGFAQMMEDIREGVINCVIVKDLSRLGRDYIEAGKLIQRVFPAFSVRFIALTDGYDSLWANRSERFLMVPVKNFINDAYCRDISMKVRSHLEILRRQGKFVGAFAPYGYRKDETEKGSLIPDEETAVIVRQIFAWKLEGLSMNKIAKRLNEQAVPSPLEYRRQQKERYVCGFASETAALWSPMAIKRILTNEIYTGTMVQGKRKKLGYKAGKPVALSPEEWIRVEHTHPALISREMFEQVQKMMKKNTI